VKYCFTTLATGEDYFYPALRFFLDLERRTSYCNFIIVTTEKDMSSLEKEVGTSYENFKVLYPRLQIRTIESFSFRLECPLAQEGAGFVYNVNLKALAIKATLKGNYDYVLYVDGDWNVSPDFNEKKVFRLFEEMEKENLDFVFERPGRIGDDRVKPETSFYRDKIYDYEIEDIPIWDEAHVANEQFLAFKNSWKLKVFTQKWEQLMWYSIANNIRNYAEGFEIGIAALEATMKWSWRVFSVMGDCFYFYAKWTRTKHTKF
jgi:hypothetical protein